MGPKNESLVSPDSEPPPVMLEPELQEVAETWGPLHRKEVGQKLERWGRQLQMSAELMKRGKMEMVKEPDIVLPDTELAGLIGNSTNSHCLELAAKFESWAWQLRHFLGVGEEPEPVRNPSLHAN